MRTWFLSAICFLATFLFGQSQAADPPGLTEVVARHRQTLESISTLHLKMLISNSPETEFGNEMSECWVDGDNFRVIYRTKGEFSLFNDTNTKGGISKTYSNTTITKTGIGSNNGAIGINIGYVMGNPLPYCLFRVFSSGKTRDVPFWTLLEEPRHSTTIENATIEGDDYDIVTLSHEKAKLKIWFSKKHNYLIKKIHQWYPPDAKAVAWEREVKEFQEVSPGVFFPAKVISRNYKPKTGEFQREGTILLTEIEINRPPLPTAFEFHFPADILVFDAVKQKVWRTDEAGEIGGEARLEDGTIHEYKEGGGLANVQLPESKYPTKSEPASLGEWVFLVAIALILTGLILLTMKRFGKSISG